MAQEQIGYRMQVPVRGDYDVIVAGGGVAGVAAAVCAARLGKQVLLIEKSVCLGGLSTIGLVNFFEPLCNGRGTKIIGGMAEELFRLSIRYGFDTVPAEWNEAGENARGEAAQTRYVTRFSAPLFALALTEFVTGAGVELLFDTVITRPVMKGGRCEGLIVENRSGASCYRAKMFIDATGDAELLFRAGVPTVQGKNYHTFYLYGADLESCRKVAETGDFSKLFSMRFGGPSDLYGKGHPAGKPCWKGTDGDELSRYIVENHLEALDKLRGDDRKTRDILQIPTMPQLRTTRRIDGDRTLMPDDTYRHFEDSVGAICDFDRRDYLYEVPYRALVKTGYPNLITAGRSASGSGYAWDVLRVIPPAILTGQAAGAAVCQAIETGTGVDGLDVARLQKTLSAQGVGIHFDDRLIPRVKREDQRDDLGPI